LRIPMGNNTPAEKKSGIPSFSKQDV